MVRLQKPIAPSGWAPDVPEPKAAAWTPPPSRLPAAFVEAVRFLQAHGMADPRGGKFTLAHTGRLLDWDAIYTMPTISAGWIAKQADGKTRFVADDGLAYGVWSGDRHPTIDSYFALPPSQRARTTRRRDLDRRQSVLNESTPAPSGSANPLAPLPGWDLEPDATGTPGLTSSPDMQAALLLVDGRADLAKTVLGARQPTLATLASDLLKSKWNRALETYARGEDRAALALLQDLEAVRSACEQRLGRSSFPFLRQEPELAKDIRRRLKEAPASTRSAHSTIEQKIAAIEDYAPSPSRIDAPGSNPATSQPDDLLAAGDSAIEPLLRAAGTDSRLTRQIMAVGGAPYVTPVRELALRILNTLTGASFHPDHAGNLPSEARLGAWWSRNRSLSIGEREFRFLADDAGDELQWICAARQISGLTPVDSKDSGVVLRWSQLRLTAHKNPSVSELMIRRMSWMLASSSWTGRVVGAKVMELCLEKWDPSAAAATARGFSERLMEVESAKDVPHVAADGTVYEGADPDLVRLLEQRIVLGDGAALPTYTRLMLRNPAGSPADSYRFLYSHQDVPAVAALTRQLFYDPVAAAPSAKLDPGALPRVLDVARSPFVNLPAVQDALVVLLRNKAPYRTYDGKGTPENGDAPSGPGGYTERACDFVASTVMNTGGVAIRPEWPDKQKNAIVNSLIETLRRHPKHFWPRDEFDTPPVRVASIAGGRPGRPGLRP